MDVPAKRCHSHRKSRMQGPDQGLAGSRLTRSREGCLVRGEPKSSIYWAFPVIFFENKSEKGMETALKAFFTRGLNGLSEKYRGGRVAARVQSGTALDEQQNIRAGNLDP